jgi:flagellar hook-associated protein 2
MAVGPVSFGGLASGFDTQAIIEAILRAESKPLERLRARQELLRRKEAALDELRGKLSAFEGALRGLDPEITFRGRVATVSDETKLAATAGAGAETGLFSVEVVSLASAHKVRSESFASPDQGLLSDGTITLQAGDRDPVTIEVSAEAGNNSLEAVRDAINAANAGLAASIVYDGTGYRLLVRSEETGLSNALSITDTTNLALADGANLVTAAADASVRVDGLLVTSPSNRVTGVVPGVVLDLRAVTTAGPVTVEVREDTEGVVEAVQSFVRAYNDLLDFFRKQFDREQPGPLAGDPVARGALFALQGVVASGVEGIPLGGIRSLSAIGVSLDGKTGALALDTAELRDLLESRFDEVGRLFLASATATSPKIRYQASTEATRAGTYAVEISRAAEQASLVGSAPITTLARDETLTVTLGGRTATVLLTAGMSGAEVLAAVNAALREEGVAATALDDAGRLRITSREFGSSVELSVVSDQEDPGDGTGSGFGTTPSVDTGVDVAGRIGGADATGSGQLLTAADDGPYAGLTLRVLATAADIASTGGDFGTVSFSAGLVRTLAGILRGYTRSGDGPLAGARGALEDGLRRLAGDIERFEARIEERRGRLLRTFAEVEKAIAALQSQQAAFSNFTTRLF